MSQTKKTFIRWIIIGVVIGGCAAAIVHYWPKAGTTAAHAQTGGMHRGMKGAGAFAGGAIPVQTAHAAIADVPLFVSALGTVAANATVTVTSQVDGQLLKVFFTHLFSIFQNIFLNRIKSH